MLRPIDSTNIDPLLHHLPKRAQLPQPTDHARDPSNHIINLLLGREPPYSEPQTRVRHVLRRSEGTEDVRGLEGGGGACGAGGEGDVLEGHEEGLAFDVGEGEVDAAWVAVEGAVADYVGDAGGYAFDEAVGEGFDPGGVAL